jgi:hypothetical protein
VAIPRPYYQGVSGLTGDGKKKIDGHYAMQANTQKVRQVDVQGGFTAAAGHNFYTARAFPEEYWNRIAFVNEPTGHVVHRAIVERQGSGFAEKDGWNVAASDDEWFAPVHAEVGPDGALWLLDFYDFIIQHNPTPIGRLRRNIRFRTAVGNAYDTPLREHDRGRIYRLVWKEREAVHAAVAEREPAARARAGAPPRQHVLAHDGTAPHRRARQDRRRPADHRRRQRSHRRQDRSEFRRRSCAVDAARLGVLDGSNSAALDAATRALFAPGRRRAQGGAVGAAPVPTVSRGVALGWRAHRQGSERAAERAARTLEDACVVEAGREIYRASKDQAVVEDEWLPEAVWIAATRHQEGFLQAYADESAFPR